MTDKKLTTKKTGPYRCNAHQLTYYNNDLSKFITTQLPCTFTSIDADILQFKRDYNWFRIIEYKHSHETGAGTQLELIKKLRRFCPPTEGFQFDIYLARGDVVDNMNPFCDGIDLTDLQTSRKIHLSRDELGKFLSFVPGYRTIDEILGTHNDEESADPCKDCLNGPCVRNDEDDSTDCGLRVTKER